jgi:hypothetical protein
MLTGAAATALADPWPVAAIMLEPANAPPTPPAARTPSQIHFLCDLWLLLTIAPATGLAVRGVRMMVGTRAGIDCPRLGARSSAACGFRGEAGAAIASSDFWRGGVAGAVSPDAVLGRGGTAGAGLATGRAAGPCCGAAAGAASAGAALAGAGAGAGAGAIVLRSALSLVAFGSPL